MAVFSENQVRHLYVATAYQSTIANVKSATTVGTIGFNVKDNQLYFLYKGNGGLTRSDLIKLDNIRDARIAYGSDEARAMKRYTLVLKGDYSASQDYVLGVRTRGMLGSGDSTTFDVYGNSGTAAGSASEVYKALAVQLTLNNIHCEDPLFEVQLMTTADETNSYTTVTDEVALAKGKTLTGTYTGIAIKEKNRKEDWIQGVKQITPLLFDIIDRDEMFNKTEDTDTTDKISNGRNMADLEWFCMGERGDIYRNNDPVATIHVKYVIGASDLDSDYDIINIHYFGDEDGINAGKQEKDIMIVAKHTASSNIITTLATALKAKGVSFIYKNGTKMATY